MKNTLRSNRTLQLWLTLIAGLGHLSGEIVYLKALDYAIGAVPWVRLTVVATFLAGIGVGANLSTRMKKPWLAEFSLAVYATIFLIGFWPLTEFVGHTIQYTSHWLHPHLVASIFGILLIAVPSIFGGMLLPVMMESSRQVARPYLWHAAGGVIGLVWIEFAIYPFVGLEACFLLIIAVHLIVACGLIYTGSYKQFVVPACWWPSRIVIVGTATGMFQGVSYLGGALLVGPLYFMAPTMLVIYCLGTSIGTLLWTRYNYWSFPRAIGLAVFGMLATTVLFAYTTQQPKAGSQLSALCDLVVVFAPASILIGSLYPAFVTEERSNRSHTGAALLSICLGNAMGILIGGGWLTSWFAVHECMLLAIVPLAVFQIHQKKWLISLLWIGFASILYAKIDEEDFIRPSFSTQSKVKLEYVARSSGELSAIVVRKSSRHRKRTLFQSGYTPMTLETDGGLIQEARIGAFAIAHAPRIDEAMVIGAGSGRTAGFVAAIAKHTDVIDVGATVPALLHELRAINYHLLENSRMNFHWMDAIHAPYMFDEASFDIIVQTLHPGYIDRAAKLYTYEYLDRLARLLKNDGVFVTWSSAAVSDVANEILVSTLDKVFTYSQLVSVDGRSHGDNYFAYVASQVPLRRNLHHLANSPLSDEIVVRELLDMPLEDRLLEKPSHRQRIHSFRQPAVELLMHRNLSNKLPFDCSGECVPGDQTTLNEPCDEPFYGRWRQKIRRCSEGCKWHPWSTWSKCRAK